MESGIPHADPQQGLPPVAPPSGKFIFQLFIVPGLIVLAIVICFVGFTGVYRWIFGGPSNPEQYLRSLDDTNPEVRWRAAQDLAQVLLRDEHMASNPGFALDLADRLRQALRDNEQAEKALADRLRGKANDEADNERRTLEPGQSYVRYLSACLGSFSLPVGVPLLRAQAEATGGLDAKAAARQRWQAVWALANLGNQLERFGKLSAERQADILAELEDEAAASGERGRWAKLTLDYLKDVQAGKRRTLGVEQTLAVCAADANPFLRAIAAFALNFWEGDAAENARIEAALVKLSYDDGRGEELVAPFFEEDEYQAEARAKKPGSRVRYNAAVALARKGSGKVRLGVLEEMLDEEALADNFRVRRKDGQEVPDQAVVASTLTNALKAVAELHRKNPTLNLSALTPFVDKLAKNANPRVKTEAERTLLALNTAK